MLLMFCFRFSLVSETFDSNFFCFVVHFLRFLFYERRNINDDKILAIILCVVRDLE